MIGNVDVRKPVDTLSHFSKKHNSSLQDIILSETPEKGLPFSPSQFLNTTSTRSSEKLLTSTPLDCKSTVSSSNKISDQIVTSFQKGQKHIVSKRKIKTDPDFVTPKARRCLMNTLPRTPTPLRASPKNVLNQKKIASKGISHAQSFSTPLSAAQHDVHGATKECNPKTNVANANHMTDTSVRNDLALRADHRKCYFTRQNPTCSTKLSSTNVLAGYCESTCLFEPRRYNKKDSISCSVPFSALIQPIVNYATSSLTLQDQICKVEWGSTKSRSLTLHNRNNSTNTLMFKTLQCVLYGQTDDQKLLTRQSRLLMKDNCNL